MTPVVTPRGDSPPAGHQATGVTGIDYFPVYYTWYSGPKQWVTNSDYFPALGKYRSNQRAVIDNHLGSLEDNGGAGFTVNWHGPTGFHHDALVNHFLPELRNHPGQEFCIHYDPFIRWGLPLPEFGSDAQNAATWRADARYMARSLMSDPQYARVDGRPLVFVYVTRAILRLRDLRAFVDIARQEAQDAGHSGLFLVLGEVWWIPTDVGPIDLEIIRARRAPRTRLGDAVYSYNLATPPELDKIWRSNIRTFMGEAGRVYKDYRNLMDNRGAPRVPVITTLMPRFDNTVLRAQAGKPAGSQIGPWLGHGGVDYKADVAVGLQKLSPSFEPVRGDRTIVVVTSWNEWPERSALEPAMPGVDKDNLPRPNDDYLVGLGQAVAGFSAGRPEPALRPEWRADREREALESVALGLELASLGPERTERVTADQVSESRWFYRALIAHHER